MANKVDIIQKNNLALISTSLSICGATVFKKKTLLFVFLFTPQENIFTTSYSNFSSETKKKPIGESEIEL